MAAAVLTGDIVNSTKMGVQHESALVKKLQLILEPYQFEFYRGDSFQVLVKNAQDGLRVALLCRTAAIAINDNMDKKADVRISIGIGPVKLPVKSLGSAKGATFILSGRGLDDLSVTGKRLSISVGKVLAGLAFEILADYMNAIFSNITARQAEVIFEMLQGQTQQEVASLLEKSKSTIHQHVTAARWSEIEKLLNQYVSLINYV